MQLPIALRCPLRILILAICFIEFGSSPSKSNEIGDEFYITKYRLVNSEERERIFSEFVDILQAKVETLSAEMASYQSAYPRAHRIGLKTVEDHNGSPIASISFTIEGYQSLMRDLGARGLMIGRLRGDTNGNSVRTRFFNTGGHERLGSPFVTIDLNIAENEFDSTRDSHSAMILYSIGVEVIESCELYEAGKEMLSESALRIGDLGDLIREKDVILNDINARVAEARSLCF